MTDREVWIYRHGQSAANAGERTADFAQIPLTALGHAQARTLAERFEATPGAIVASPFLRSAQTAAPLVARFSDAALSVWDIQEFTILDGPACANSTWQERKPRLDAYWARLDPDYVDGPGAESFSAMLDRAHVFLARMAMQDTPLTVAVSHGNFMQGLLMLLEEPGLAPRDAMKTLLQRQAARPFANCERLRLRIQRGEVLPMGRMALF